MRWVHRFATLIVAVALAVPLASLELALSVRSASASVASYYDPSVSVATGIASGPDGALWFANSGIDSIGRITTNGTISHYALPAQSNPVDIAVGSDGALWFTNNNSNAISRITTAGVITNYTGSSGPNGITAGPDGALWFVNQGSSIGRITTSGAITDFTDPGINNAVQITTGPDGALWFTNGDNSIGRITTSGTVTNYTDPSVSAPQGITAGPDGALWFTNYGGTIGRITTSGTITHFKGVKLTGTHSAAGTGAITAGPDGALWFTNYFERSIGRMTTAGVLSAYTDPAIAGANSITNGPDGALWFTNGNSNSIGRITVPGPPTKPGAPQPSFSAIPFNSGTAKVTWHSPITPGCSGSCGAPITGYVVTPFLGNVAQSPRLFASAKTIERVTGLRNGKTYRFTIAARNAIGTGPPSPKTQPMTVGAPGRTSTPKAEEVASGTFKVAFRPGMSNGAPIKSYTVTCTTGNKHATRTGTGTGSPIRVTGLWAAHSYSCAVTATNSRGTGPSSARSNAITA